MIPRFIERLETSPSLDWQSPQCALSASRAILLVARFQQRGEVGSQTSTLYCRKEQLIESRHLRAPVKGYG